MMTLKFVYPETVATAVTRIAPYALVNCQCEKTRHWSGGHPPGPTHHLGYRPTWTVRPELPADVGGVWDLLRALFTVSVIRDQLTKPFERIPLFPRATGQKAREFGFKLAACIGLPPLITDFESTEAALLRSIAEKPHDLSAWLVYADCCDEAGGDAARRAALIRLWAHPTAKVPVKNGMPKELQKVRPDTIFDFGGFVRTLLVMDKPISRFSKRKFPERP